MIDKQEVEAMINAKLIPLAHKLSRRRIEWIVDERTKPLIDRVAQNERDIQQALAGYTLVRDLIEEKFARLDLTSANQQRQIMQRLDLAEGWIGSRRRWERVAVRVSQVAGLRLLRVWLPFITLVLVMVGMVVALLGGLS